MSVAAARGSREPTAREQHRHGGAEQAACAEGSAQVARSTWSDREDLHSEHDDEQVDRPLDRGGSGGEGDQRPGVRPGEDNPGGGEQIARDRPLPLRVLSGGAQRTHLASSGVDRHRPASAAQARPAPSALISTPASAGPTNAPTPSLQLVATLAEVSSSGWRTTRGIRTWCRGLLTPSESEKAIAASIHDGHGRPHEDCHATASQGGGRGGVSDHQQAAWRRRPGQAGADHRGEKHRRDQLQDRNQTRLRGATARKGIDEDGEPLAELGNDHHQA